MSKSVRNAARLIELRALLKDEGLMNPDAMDELFTLEQQAREPALLQWEHDASETVTMTQQGANRFTVTYGEQVKDHLSYERAAREFGECVMHAASCAGLIDNA